MTDFDIIFRNFGPEKDIHERVCRCGNVFQYDPIHGASKKLCDDCQNFKPKKQPKTHEKRLTNPVTVVGCFPDSRIPKEDYSDYWLGQEFTFDEVCYMVYAGSFTPGIVLQRAGVRVIVVGQDEQQEVRVI